MTNHDEVEILPVEDNPHDAEMAIRALKKNNLANNVLHITDGVEALDFIFARGAYSARKIESGPKIVLPDLKLPKSKQTGSPGSRKKRRENKDYPCYHTYIVKRGKRHNRKLPVGCEQLYRKTG
jgi:CheY-like chemotaxis protein